METSSLKACLERADELAHDVVNVWNRSISADFSPEFKTILHKTFLYLTAKKKADDHRAFGILTERDETEEKAARIVFCASVLKVLRGHASRAVEAARRNRAN
jgi:hypothetical protein